MYKMGKRRGSKGRRLIGWAVLLLLVGGLIFGTTGVLREKLQPHTVITKTTPRVSSVAYENKMVHFEEPDFSLDLPAGWQPVARPAGPYQTYAWQISQAGAKGQEFKVYQDTIPSNFAVNRVVVIEGQTDHVQQSGNASDNCATFTRGLTPAAGQVGVPAKWQNISFLCDQFNQQRDVIGTSSSDGVNTVRLKSSAGVVHAYFFTYTNQAVNPDYTIFYNALRSFRLK